MAKLENKIIESMIKDLENIKNFVTGKILRKECSLLLKRIEDAKKLFATNENLISQLNDIEQKVKELKK